MTPTPKTEQGTMTTSSRAETIEGLKVLSERNKGTRFPFVTQYSPTHKTTVWLAYDEVLDSAIAHLQSSDAKVEGEQGANQRGLVVMTFDQLKKHAVDFYRWWHNRPGTNTEQGYDDFIAGRDIPTGPKEVEQGARAVMEEFEALLASVERTARFVGASPYAHRGDEISACETTKQALRQFVQQLSDRAAPQVMFQAACSGLWYSNPMACGAVMAVRVGDKVYSFPAQDEAAPPCERADLVELRKSVEALKLPFHTTGNEETRNHEICAGDTVVAEAFWYRDAQAIVAACNALPGLIAEVERLQKIEWCYGESEKELTRIAELVGGKRGWVEQAVRSRLQGAEGAEPIADDECANCGTSLAKGGCNRLFIEDASCEIRRQESLPAPVQDGAKCDDTSNRKPKGGEGV